MGIHIRSKEEMGTPLAASNLPIIRLNRHERRAAGKRKGYGRRYRHEAGHADYGHRTHYYHPTKGWRMRHAVSRAVLRGSTLVQWLIWRGDMIEATKKRDAELARGHADCAVVHQNEIDRIKSLFKQSVAY